MRRPLLLTSLLALGALAPGCFEIADPTTPCAEMSLGEADPTAMVAGTIAPVVAIAGGETPFVLHYICPEFADAVEHCELHRSPLEDLDGGNAVLVTAAGNHVVATDADSQTLLSYEVHPQLGVRKALFAPMDSTTPVRLLASLRNSDIVLTRDLEGNLRSFDPSSGTQAKKIAPDHEGMLLAVVGEKHAVGRIRLDGEREELYLIPVDDSLDHLYRGPVRLGAAAKSASRIVITPRDEYVAVTYGEGDSAETMVFRVPDGERLQSFSGELVSGREPLAELSGLRAVSPDGSQLAYRTPQGSLAMRSLEDYGSCMVRKAPGEDTRIAGFSANGLLYFETHAGPGRTGVGAWVPHQSQMVELSPLEEGYVLSAVPARAGDDDDTPWAVGANDSRLAALQESANPASLGLGEPVFVARDDANIWAVNTTDEDPLRGLEDRKSFSDARFVGLKRIEPKWSNQLRAFSFDDPRDPTFDDLVPRDGDEPDGPQILDLVFSGPQRVCMSTGTPGSWAYKCGTANDDRSFLAAGGLPGSEDPHENPSSDPEVPTTDDGWKCSTGGTPRAQASFFCYEVEGCCFRRQETACGLLGCSVDSCVVAEEGQRHMKLACGNPGQ